MQSDAAPVSLAELYARFRGPAYSLARRILVDDALAEDVVQDAFLSVWLRPDAFDPARGGYSSWLMALVHHKAVDAVRREQSQRTRQVRALNEAAGTIGTIEDPEDAVCDRAVADRVRVALAALPEGQRRALALAYFNGFTQREIAALTGTPLGTVKSRMRVGMSVLRAVLREVADTAPGPVLAGA
jgi:RNA polymerase sigma-70 factor (ECF subfamily)